VLTAFLFACTRPVPREGVEVRRYRVEWDSLAAQVLALDGLEVRGVVLTPSRWPLERSLKRLFGGDVIGFVEGLELTFQPSRIPEGVLEDLFEAGFLPAYVRVRNTGDAPREFGPLWLAVAVDGERLLAPVAPAGLPETLARIDWESTGKGIVLVALLVAIVVLSAREGRSAGGRVNLPGMHARGEVGMGSFPTATPPAGPPSEEGLLKAGTLAPGEAREGMVFFRVGQPADDWSTARLIPNR
jgi:hypothetical protein